MNNNYDRPDGWGNQTQEDPWNTTSQQSSPFPQRTEPYPMQNPAPMPVQAPEKGRSTLQTNDILILIIAVLIVALIAVGIILVVILQKKPDAGTSTPVLESTAPVQQPVNVIPATEPVRIEAQPVTTENRIIAPVDIQTIPPTAAPTIAQTAAKPRISARIEVSQIIGGDGYEFTLVVGGDYAYYEYEVYEYIDYYDDGTEFLGKFRSDQPSVRLTAGSSLTYVMAVVTPYNADNISGETVTCLEYLPQAPPAQQNSGVEQCWQQGEIITYGKKVASFTTDYVVNHGKSAHVRDSLGNGWHIVAVNHYYSYGIHWYELYDADDGDYYGWVDLEYIDFW